MIRYFSEDTQFSLSKKRLNNAWLKSAVEAEGKRLGQLNIIFCSDDYLLDINKKFLSHDYYTDIITFDYCEGVLVSGDLFISIDTVRENSSMYNSDFDTELARVMVHGVLHLIGYDDHSESDQIEMRTKENQYLELR